MIDKKCSCYKPDTLQKTNDSLLCYSSTDTLTIPDATSIGTSFRIASLFVDNRNKCPSDIKFNFSSNVITDSSISTIDFQIYKQCCDQISPTPVGSVWTYTRLILGGEGITFSFKACDTIGDERCVYYVLITVTTAPTTGIISIQNANLSALVIGGHSQSHCRCPELHTSIFSKCGHPSAIPIAEGTPQGTTFTLATLALNAENYIDPCIELEFASNVIFPGSILIAFLQVYKQCHDQLTPIPVGPIWFLEHSLPEFDNNTFTFHIHDCDCTDNERCTYQVILTVQLSLGGTTLFRNSMLRATIADRTCKC